MLSSEAGPVCVQSRTTSIGSDSAQFRWILLTGYLSGFSLYAGEANPSYFQPRTTYVGSNLVLTSQSMVTIYLPVDDYDCIFSLGLAGVSLFRHFSWCSIQVSTSLCLYLFLCMLMVFIFQACYSGLSEYAQSSCIFLVWIKKLVHKKKIHLKFLY